MGLLNHKSKASKPDGANKGSLNPAAGYIRLRNENHSERDEH